MKKEGKTNRFDNRTFFPLCVSIGDMVNKKVSKVIWADNVPTPISISPKFKGNFHVCLFLFRFFRPTNSFCRRVHFFSLSFTKNVLSLFYSSGPKYTCSTIYSITCSHFFSLSIRFFVKFNLIRMRNKSSEYIFVVRFDSWNKSWPVCVADHREESPSLCPCPCAAYSPFSFVQQNEMERTKRIYFVRIEKSHTHKDTLTTNKKEEKNTKKRKREKMSELQSRIMCYNFLIPENEDIAVVVESSLWYIWFKVYLIVIYC